LASLLNIELDAEQIFLHIVKEALTKAPTTTTTRSERIRKIGPLRHFTKFNRTMLSSVRELDDVLVQSGRSVAQQLSTHIKAKCEDCIGCSGLRFKVESRMSELSDTLEVRTDVSCHMSRCPDEHGMPTFEFVPITSGGGGVGGSPDTETYRFTKDGREVLIHSVRVPHSSNFDKPTTTNPEAW